MVVTGLLLGLLTVATVTDVRWRKIYNWTTYPGILLAMLLSAFASWRGAAAVDAAAAHSQWLGIIALEDSALGLLACGAVMILCYVFFPGGVGGGDVKLVAMIGAYLGVMAGLEAMLWTFVLGGCLALISLIWRFGLLTLVVRGGKFLLYKLRLGGAFPLSGEERQPLKTELFLSPSALAAVCIVRFQLLAWLY